MSKKSKNICILATTLTLMCLISITMANKSKKEELK